MEGVGWSEQSVSSPVPAWAVPPRKYGICFALAYAESRCPTDIEAIRNDLDEFEVTEVAPVLSLLCGSQWGLLPSYLPDSFFPLSRGKLCWSFLPKLLELFGQFDVAWRRFEALIWLELLVDQIDGQGYFYAAFPPAGGLVPIHSTPFLFNPRI